MAERDVEHLLDFTNSLDGTEMFDQAAIKHWNKCEYPASCEGSNTEANLDGNHVGTP